MPNPSHAIRSTTRSVLVGLCVLVGVLVSNLVVMSGHLAPEVRALEPLAGARPSPLMAVPFRFEDPQGALQLADGAVGMTARAAAGDLIGPAAEPLELPPGVCSRFLGFRVGPGVR